MTYDYPKFEQLGCAPDYLTIGASVMHLLKVKGYLAPPVRTLPAAQRREYDRTQKRNWRKKALGGQRIA
jgi:hypothetical protein